MAAVVANTVSVFFFFLPWYLMGNYAMVTEVCDLSVAVFRHTKKDSNFSGLQIELHMLMQKKKKSIT